MTERTSEHRLDPADPLQLDRLLTDEERMLRDTVRRFVTSRVLPGIEEWFEAGTFPRELIPEMAAIGLFGMTLEGYGCAGANPVSYGLACLELEAGDSGFRSFISVQGALAMFPLWKYGTEEQKQEWLPEMAAGRKIGCFGLTEPDAGSDPSRMRTHAKRKGSDWVLSGTKMWITNGGIADMAVVWAQTDEGIRGFIVPTDTPGFSTRDIHRKMSLRASITSELILDEVVVPGDALLEGANGLKGPLSCLSEARFGILFGAMGAARTCFLSALEYSKTRMQFDRAIASFQLTQRKLVEMALKLNQGTLLAIHLARAKEQGNLRPEMVSFGKLSNVRAALEVAREARTVLGANGVTLEYPPIRHANNLESVLTYEGTSEIHTLILGQALTGERAFA